MHNSGSQVVSDNAQGGATPGFFTAVLGALSTGVRGIIDIELAERAGSIPDQADLRENTPAIDPSQPQSTALADVFRNLTATQMIGGIVAIGLAFGLATGKFKF